jgi:hypothetical protein
LLPGHFFDELLSRNRQFGPIMEDIADPTAGDRHKLCFDVPGNRRSAILSKDIVSAYGVDVLGVEQKSIYIKDEGSYLWEAIFRSVLVRASGDSDRKS